ncbi:hypothetical protein BU16DRAFT_537400 [Lophium mytilinum]|uniref:AttH domain-containing protein n=1 Tax=Lophium mytilinum TaxID=390894 RepID=A0A6A6R0N0_9PEZI|nr:hypothetical protein BU16DRAFT_537400 [Lophium mytilinum]
MAPITSLFSALALLITPSLAFLRTAQDRSPLDYQYSSTVGAPNVTNVIAFNTTGIKSYWFANFLHASDGNDYCIVTTTANAGPTGQITSISYTDITNGHIFGGSWHYDGQLSNTKLYGSTPILTTGARSDDQISELYVTSTQESARFNLTYVPKGPNLYQAGVGAYIWGTGYAYAYDYPETYVTGTLVNFANETVDIVPEQSQAWFDMQWGPSYAAGGWHAYVILLNNGVKIQATITNPVSEYNQASLATIAYPDGHHEVYPVVGGVHPADPWVSELSNITYYSSYRIDVPGKKLSLDVRSPWKSGETALLTDPTPANTIADTFAWFSGYFDGVAVEGFGISEERVSALGGLFG